MKRNCVHRIGDGSLAHPTPPVMAASVPPTPQWFVPANKVHVFHGDSGCARNINIKTVCLIFALLKKK